MNNNDRNGEEDSNDGSYNYLMTAFASLAKTTTKVIKSRQSSMIIEVLNNDLAMTEGRRRGKPRKVHSSTDHTYSVHSPVSAAGHQQNYSSQQRSIQPSNIQQIQGNQQKRQINRSRIVEQHPGIVQQLIQNSRFGHQVQSSPSNNQYNTQNAGASTSVQNFNSNTNQGQMSNNLQTFGNVNMQGAGGSSQALVPFYNNQTGNYYTQMYGNSMPSTVQQTNVAQYLEDDRRCMTNSVTNYAQNQISFTSAQQRITKRNVTQTDYKASDPEMTSRCITPHPSMFSNTSYQQQFVKPGPVENRKRKIEQISRDILQQNPPYNPFDVNNSNNYNVVQPQSGTIAQNIATPSIAGTTFSTFDNRQELQGTWSSSTQNVPQNDNIISYSRRTDTPHPGIDNFAGWTNNTLTSTPFYRQNYGYNTVNYQKANAVNAQQWNNSNAVDNSQRITSVSNLSNNCDYWNSNNPSTEFDINTLLNIKTEEAATTQAVNPGLINQNYDFKFSGVKSYSTNNTETGYEFNNYQNTYQQPTSAMSQQTQTQYGNNVSGSTMIVQQNFQNQVPNFSLLQNDPASSMLNNPMQVASNFVNNQMASSNDFMVNANSGHNSINTQTFFNVSPASDVKTSNAIPPISTNDQQILQDNQVTPGHGYYSYYNLRSHGGNATHQHNLRSRGGGSLASFNQIKKFSNE